MNSADAITLTNHVGRAEPQSSPDERPAAALTVSRRAPRRVKGHGNLSGSIKRALLILLDDKTLLERSRDRRGRVNGSWISANGQTINFQTIEAMFDRYLLKIEFEDNRLRRHVARLTEIGERVARDLRRERDSQCQEISMHSRLDVSAESQHLISELVA